jgi:hypothetical protein
VIKPGSAGVSPASFSNSGNAARTAALPGPGGICLSPGLVFATLRAMRKSFFGLWLALAVSASGAEIKIAFSEIAVGQSPTNFHHALAGTGQPGNWKIVADESPSALAPLMPQIASTAHTVRRPVLAQLSQDPTDEHFPMLIYDGQTFKDFKLATQFKIVGGTAEQMAGIVFRFENASNFYVLRASALGHNVRFYKVVNGIRSDPIGPMLDIATNTWHTLAVQCRGAQITCWLDGKPLMTTLNDSSFSTGKIGFWTKSDAVSYFGDTTIDYIPMVPAAQTLVRDIMKKYPRIQGLRIYTPDDKGQVRVLASKVESEVGLPGTDAEQGALASGKVFYGSGKGSVSVTMALNDRNGEPIAAVHVQLKSYMLGETRDMVLTRVHTIVNEMQKRVLTKQDLME